MPAKPERASQKIGPEPRKGVVVPPGDRAPLQRVINPSTGQDITGQYISDGLQKLEDIGRKLIDTAQWLAERHPDWKEVIYEDFREWLHVVIGQGSLGPATAAAGPLLNQMQEELARHFGKD